MNSDYDEYILYALEEPVIRYRGQVTKCEISPQLKAINPAEVYMDETSKLAYSTYGLLKSARKKVRRLLSSLLVRLYELNLNCSINLPYFQRKVTSYETHEKPERPVQPTNHTKFTTTKLSSILDSLKTKEVTEFSGATVRIVDLVSNYDIVINVVNVTVYP